MRVTLVLLGDGPGPAVPTSWEMVRRREEATGEVVAVFDTRYEAGPQWAEPVGSVSAVGGRVLPAPGYTWSAWLYYVIEYGWESRIAEGNVARKRGAVSEGVLDARMDVHLARPPTFGAYVKERFALSRDWAARHLTPITGLLRIALPILVLLRVPWWRKPSTLPGVVLMSLVMAAGEIAGSWRGRSVTVKS